MNKDATEGAKFEWADQIGWIVLVATFSLHRKESFESCNCIMEYLKKDAPFWKKEFYNDSYKWL